MLHRLDNLLTPYPKTKRYPRELVLPLQVNTMRDGVGIFITVRLFHPRHWWPMFRNGITGLYPDPPDWIPE